MKTLVVVDAQNDFISGSLACQGSESALENIVKLIENDRDMAVVYTADWHSKSNESFKENGGIWRCTVWKTRKAPPFITDFTN